MSEAIVTEVEYRELPEFPGYRFGSDGSVWSRWTGSHSSTGTCGIKRVSMLGEEWNLRQPTVNPNSGYCQMQLKTAIDGKVRYKTCRIHPLILKAFRGPKPKGMQACHNNGIRTDNRIENLRWDTGKANQADRIDHGTYLKGEALPWTKLTEEQVREIRRRAENGEHRTRLAEEYGIARCTIDQIYYRQTWKHLR